MAAPRPAGRRCHRRPEPVRRGTPRGHRVEMRGVRFGYPGGPEVLRGIDLALEPGTVTAVAGPPGCGKSTLVKLLPRLLDPTGGSILLGGVDLRRLSGRELRRTVSYALPDVRLSPASVADNIALATPDVDREDIVRAARQANLHDRIVELPRGYDTVLGREARLSAGEARRISLARALLAATPILVLDEALCSGDPLAELAVHRTITTLGWDRTVLVVARSRETVAAADTAVLLARGSIVECGRRQPADSTTRCGR